MRVRRKPTEIDAVQFDGHPSKDPPSVFRRPEDDTPYVVTIHGQRAYLTPGDWIAPEPDGVHFYPIKASVFEATYEAVEPDGPTDRLAPWWVVSTVDLLRARTPDLYRIGYDPVTVTEGGEALVRAELEIAVAHDEQIARGDVSVEMIRAALVRSEHRQIRAAAIDNATIDIHRMLTEAGVPHSVDRLQESRATLRNRLHVLICERDRYRLMIDVALSDPAVRQRLNETLDAEIKRQEENPRSASAPEFGLLSTLGSWPVRDVRAEIAAAREKDLRQG